MNKILKTIRDSYRTQRAPSFRVAYNSSFGQRHKDKDRYIVIGTAHLISNMSTSTQDLAVEHDKVNRKFLIKLANAEAKLEYVEEKHNDDIVWVMWHTEVPQELQGKGIAKILAKEAFDYVADNNMKMQLTCSYLQKYLKDNPLDKYTSSSI